MAATKPRANAPLDGPNRDGEDPRNSLDELTDSSFEVTTTPISHRERRKAKKQYLLLPNNSASASAPEIASDIEIKPKSKSSVRKGSPQPASLPRSLPPPSGMPPGNPIPLFIASIGNPPPKYAHTLHSAGHTVLEQLARLRSFTPFLKSRNLGGGLVSQPDTRNSRLLLPKLRSTPDGQLAPGQEDWTLWQSPSLMNISGKPLKEAWRVWSAEKKRDGEQGLLVVLHDELESALGKVSIRRGGSARGHNGLKSIAAHLPGQEMVRVGIGIGRPVSREPNDVANYVLRKMTGKEREVIERAAGEVIFALRDVAEGKK